MKRTFVHKSDPHHKFCYHNQVEKLIKQFIKFGFVGTISFLVDYCVGLATLNVIMAVTSKEFFEIASLIGSILGFTISVIVNYVLSFKYVFERKENLNRKAEFTIFVVLSAIGLLINSLIIWVCVGPIYGSSELLQQNASHNVMYTGAKVLATAIVMVYNFVSRKIFLEKK